MIKSASCYLQISEFTILSVYILYFYGSWVDHAIVLHRNRTAQFHRAILKTCAGHYRLFKPKLISSNKTEKANSLDSNLRNNYKRIYGVVCIIYSAINGKRTSLYSI